MKGENDLKMPQQLMVKAELMYQFKETHEHDHTKQEQQPQKHTKEHTTKYSSKKKIAKQQVLSISGR